MINIDDVLFEVSNEDRLAILRYLEDSYLNVTQLSDKIEIRLQQTSRHLQRLLKAGLVKKEVSGDYGITNFGWLLLRVINYANFISNNKDNLKDYQLRKMPTEQIMTLDVFGESMFMDNAIDFLRFIGKNIEKAKEFVYMAVDNLPYLSIERLIEAPSKGVQVQMIIEELKSEPSIAFDPAYLRSSNNEPPLVSIRSCEKCDFYLYVSDVGCAISFRNETGFDYRGFTSIDLKSINWSKDLFMHKWVNAKTSPLENLENRKYPRKNIDTKGIIEGTGHPEIDFSNIQYAVDNYAEVILRGTFNIGDANIRIKKSVVIKGEGRINDVPDTKISKSGWSFPFIEEESLFHIVGKKIDVVIENLHFDNFNGSCISTSEGNSFVARNNRFTLLSSLGRGLSFGKWGDHIVGITVGGEDSETSFPGGVILEGNYLDFALSYEKGGFLDYDGLQSNPEYRPELLNHELGICVGLNIHGNCGKVIVRDNIIRNMNSRGILTFDNWDTAEIIIEGNRIESNVFGAYPYNSMMAGVGIMAQSAWSMPYSSGKVVIKGNKINLKKVNYCGIVVHGPATYTSTDGSSKLVECQIVDNDIHLDDGYLGIQVRKSDNTLIENNRLSGKAYYGLQISGAAKRNNIELHSRNNRFIGNNLDALEIKTPDTYSYNNMKRSNFAGIHVVGGFIQPHTAHVWLTDFTEGNIIELRKADETIIDQGKDNVIKTETPDR